MGRVVIGGTAIAAVSLGGVDYLVKPRSQDQLTRVLGRAGTLRRAGGLTNRARADSED